MRRLTRRGSHSESAAAEGRCVPAQGVDKGVIYGNWLYPRAAAGPADRGLGRGGRRAQASRRSSYLCGQTAVALALITSSTALHRRANSTRQDSQQFETLEELGLYVADTLGRLEMLKSQLFELTQEVLLRRQQPCGVLFCLHGPRALRHSAIWEMDQNRVLFYGSCGRRVQNTVLAGAPSQVAFC